jgi:urease accessory protein
MTSSSGFAGNSFLRPDMRVSLADVGRRGRMDLSFVLQDGRTILQNSYCEVPFKITRLLNPDSSLAHLILMQCTAGLFGGDDVECSIRVGSGARVRITQQSATRIHPSPLDRPALQRIHVIVEDGAELQLFLEPLIPFANSRLKQRTHLEVGPEGRLWFWEGFMTGRVGRGETWQFRELESETKLTSDGRLLYLDRFRLPLEHIQSTWTMREGTHMGTALCAGIDAIRVKNSLHHALPGAGVDAISDHLALARIIASSGPEFQAGFRQFCSLSA